MSWKCPKCRLTNVNYNYYCADEKCRTRIQGPLPADSFTMLLVQVSEYNQFKEARLDWFERQCYERGIEKGNPVTESEQQFAEFFTNGVKLINNMVEVSQQRGDTIEVTILEIKAFRQKLVKSIVEAKAFAYAGQKKIDELEKNGKRGSGFYTSVNEDQTASDALNAVKERQQRIKTDNQKKLSKQERLKKQMLDAGMGQEYVDKLFSPSHILASIRTKGETKDKLEKKEKAEPPEASFPVVTPPEQRKPISNPFKKKEQ